MTKSHVIFLKVCHCETEGCNSSLKRLPSILILTGCLILTCLTRTFKINHHWKNTYILNNLYFINCGYTAVLCFFTSSAVFRRLSWCVTWSLNWDLLTVVGLHNILTRQWCLWLWKVMIQSSFSVLKDSWPSQYFKLISSPDPDHRTEGFQGYSKWHILLMFSELLKASRPRGCAGRQARTSVLSPWRTWSKWSLW